MNIFPTQYSTLSAPALAKHIEQQYGYSSLQCRFMLRGVSDTYQLEGQADKYILKIYRKQHRSLEEINGEVQLLNLLKQGGALVATPIADEEGRYIQAFQAAEGIRHGVLFNFAPGQPEMNPSEEQVRITGIEMAKLHNLAASIELNYKRKEYDNYTTLIKPLQTIAPAFKDLPEEYNTLKELAATALEKLNSFDTASFSYGYCQYDFLPKNFHFDGNHLTFFDFDFAGKGYLVNDIMSYWLHYALDTYTGRNTREATDRLFAIFLEAYQTVRPLSAEEIEAIPYLNIGFWFFYLEFQYEHFDDWSNIFFTPRFLKERSVMFKKVAEMYCKS